MVDDPALIVEGAQRIMVVADVHLGIEYEMWLGGANVPSQTRKLLDRLRGLIDEQEPKRLIVLGDLKHNVPRTSWQERVEVPKFIESVSEIVEVLLVPGNHDTGLRDLAPDAEVCEPEGVVIDGIGYFHGHTWPDPEVLSARSLITAHLHPSVRLVDPLGASRSERVWVRAFSKEYKKEIVVVPAFNPLCGSLPLNEMEDEKGPLMKLTDLRCSRIYLLDGTYLGRLGKITAAQRRERLPPK
ncbi:MAG: metallophosphoesterase [Methanothrix sp.]|uniref:metallophosphoesterase n=1 Tax=Methanothrix sp. TaxID=90426 RepID=UPI0025EB630C|nr:metallophosphoesterase [Methanothrix sp.]MCQ8903634.1 metallophosphoesterase [Methanothrix sp.]